MNFADLNKSQTRWFVLISKGEIDSKKIRVEFSLEDVDMSELQNGATYPKGWGNPGECCWDEGWHYSDEEGEECAPYEEGAFKIAFEEAFSQVLYDETDMTEEEPEDTEEEDSWSAFDELSEE